MKSFMRLAFINGTSLNGQVALIDANGQTLTFAEEVKHQDFPVIAWEVIWR